MLLATAVPAKVKTVALVTPSPTVPLSGENWVITGAPVGGSICRLGNVVSAPERLAVLPAASVIVAPFGMFTAVIVSAETVLSFAPTV